MELKNHIGRLIILVKDYEDALSFYQKNFNCKVLVDYKTGEGQRFLHIGFDTEEAIGIWFLKVDANDAGPTPGHHIPVHPTQTLRPHGHGPFRRHHSASPSARIPTS